MKKKHFFDWLTTPESNEWKNGLRTGIIAAMVATLLFLIFVLHDKGLFLLYGDYNVQQIPFYQLGHDAVRQGNLQFSFLTDLGSGFISSYSYYLLGSPFFWLTIPFSSKAVPYLMAPLFILKFSLAAGISYQYLRRFTKTFYAAAVGSLLYAFSGYMIYSIFYNSFLDVVVFFPLLLIGLEDLLVEKKRGRFALAVALNLLLNYYFFVAEMVFLLLYFILRCSASPSHFTLKKTALLFLEAVLGVMIGMVLLLPSAWMVFQNPRVAYMLFGYDMLFYGPVQRYGLLLQSLFFPPEMPAFPNFFPKANSNWFSVAAYLPLFSMAGVLTFWRERKKNWLKTLTILLCIMMFIPLLNSAFNGLNGNFYTRWFFMLTLMTSLATALVIENEKMDMTFGVKVSAGFVLAFAMIGILPKKDGDSLVFFSLPNYPFMFWISVFLAFGGLMLTYFLFCRNKSRTRAFYQTATLILCGFILIYGISEITFGKIVCESSYYHDIVDRGLNADFSIPEDGFYRVDVDQQKATDNWPMFWKKPSIQAFHSTVSPGIYSFYQSLGVTRDEASRIPENRYGLRALLSVKYIFVQNNEDHIIQNPDLPPGFSLYAHQNGFDIYENQHFVPMGFWYAHKIDRETFEDCPKTSRDRLLLKGIYLEDESSCALPSLSKEEAQMLSDDDYLKDADEMRLHSCDSFQIDSHGFSAHANLPEDNVILFSIPYDGGFHATVNGKETPIVKADNGLMAISCQKGSNDIRFVYHTPGLALGMIISLGGVILFLLYRIVDIRLTKKRGGALTPDSSAPIEERERLEMEPTRTEIENAFQKKRKKRR